MAASQSTAAILEPHPAEAGGPVAQTSLVVCLGAAFQEASTEALQPLLGRLETALGQTAAAAGRVVVTYPSAQADQPALQFGPLDVHTYVQSMPASMIAVHPATTWLHAYEQMRAHRGGAVLLLGAEAESLSVHAMRQLAEAAMGGRVDLAVPRYTLPAHQGLVNAAVLSPLSRALYGARVQFPLPLDYGVSGRQAEKLAAAAGRLIATNQSSGIVWPVAEAANAGFEVAEVPAGGRELPQTNDDLSQILTTVVGSLFSDIEQRAAFWQRTRPVREVVRLEGGDAMQPAVISPDHAIDNGEIDGLLESFRNGYRNLHEIWSLVLPPNTLVGLKRLSQAPRESFALPDTLWVRIVYDFVLAHRLRTLARNHLMGAMAPLYLAWVASHVLAAQHGHVQDPEPLARAFEADKPYLVSRWRWPDRFNP